MFEHADRLTAEYDAGRPVALAVVVGVDGGGPRPLGSSMLILTDGSVHGSISGGCVEAAVVARAELVLAGDTPAVDSFTDTGDVFSAGLTCGGRIDVLTLRIGAQTPTEVVDRWRQSPAAVGLRLDGRFVLTGSAAVESALESVAVMGGAAVVDDCGTPVLVAGRPPAPAFLIYGAVDLAEPLAHLARLAGYEVTVCDARGTFATPARFPSAHHVAVARPDRHLTAEPTDARTVVCVLTHDERFDTEVLAEALRRDLAYVGAMGSRRTCTDRERRLRDAGVTTGQLASLRQPIGLDLGASTPADTALAIMAEVVAIRNGRNGAPLRSTAGPIHTGVSR